MALVFTFFDFVLTRGIQFSRPHSLPICHYLKKLAAGDFANFAVMTPDGEVVCSAVPTQDTVNVADQAFFRRAQERRDFA